MVDPETSDNAVNNKGENEEVTDSEAFVEPLDPAEAQEFQDFDPKLRNQETWTPSTVMKSFLEKYYNQCLQGRCAKPS